MTAQPLLTTTVGSFPKPPYLLEARRKLARKQTLAAIAVGLRVADAVGFQRGLGFLFQIHEVRHGALHSTMQWRKDNLRRPMQSVLYTSYCNRNKEIG